jgi:hypothetical protein
MQDEQAQHSANAGGNGAHAPREEPGNLLMDDINIPLVATAVAFFVVLLTVVIIGLQAVFYHYDTGERERKTLSQDDPRTELGALLADQWKELHAGFDARRLATAAATASAPATVAASQSKPDWKPIDEAMQLVAQSYSQGRTP